MSEQPIAPLIDKQPHHDLAAWHDIAQNMSEWDTSSLQAAPITGIELGLSRS